MSSTTEPARGISAIVVTLDESGGVAAALRGLREPEVLEIILVDGGSQDGTVEAARALVDRVIETPPGRARQMNAGASEARGSILLFLHADTIVPRGFAKAIVAACEDAIGGRFDLEIDGGGIGLRVVSAAINLRSRWSRIFTGDQALFIRREAFEELGGYPEMPLFEDLALSRAMKGYGRVACLRERVRTSGRRWQREGLVRTVLRMWVLRALYTGGFSPRRLARFYRDVR